MAVGSLRMSQRCFLPATELHMILLQIVCHLRDVVFGQFMCTRHSMFIHKRPADRRTHPSSIRHFIASQVNGSQRYLRFFIHSNQLTNHFFHKPIRGGQCHIHHVIRIRLCGNIAGSILCVTQQIFDGLFRIGVYIFMITCFHGHYCRPGVPRRLYFRDYTYMSLSCITQ